MSVAAMFAYDMAESAFGVRKFHLSITIIAYKMLILLFYKGNSISCLFLLYLIYKECNLN